MRIHNVISITYLNLVTNLLEDFYRYRRLFILIIIIKDEDEYKIEKLI